MQMIRFILNSYKDKYKYVYVYTMFERVNEIAIKQQPWKWEQIVEIRKMAKGWVATNTSHHLKWGACFPWLSSLHCSNQNSARRTPLYLNLFLRFISFETQKGIPIIDWDTYVKFLARKQGIHPEETPDLTIDQVMVIQLDKDVGRNAIR